MKTDEKDVEGYAKAKDEKRKLRADGKNPFEK